MNQTLSKWSDLCKENPGAAPITFKNSDWVKSSLTQIEAMQKP